MRRSDLADEIDVTDVDPELQRRGRDQRFELPRLQPVLRVEPFVLRQAAVMRGHRRRTRCGIAEPLGEMTREALRHVPRVDEHERRLVLVDQLREPVVVLLPDLVRHHRFERRSRQLDREIHRAAMAFVDDHAMWRP